VQFVLLREPECFCGPDEFGRFPADCAAEFGRVDVIELFRESGQLSFEPVTGCTKLASGDSSFAAIAAHWDWAGVVA
jgi:hypothetical protein